MATDQPFEEEPTSEDSYIINETVKLDKNREDNSYHYWEYGSTGRDVRGRAIARGNERIRFYILEKGELEYYENGDQFWVEYQTTTANSSISFDEYLASEEYVIIVEGPRSNGGDGPRVTVEVWES